MKCSSDETWLQNRDKPNNSLANEQFTYEIKQSLTLYFLEEMLSSAKESYI